VEGGCVTSGAWYGTVAEPPHMMAADEGVPAASAGACAQGQ